MRIHAKAVVAGTLLLGSAAPAPAAVLTIDLATTILTDQPDGDDLWRWGSFIPPLATPANGVLTVTVRFDNGFLRLTDSGASPDASQIAYRDALLARHDEQQTALSALQAEISQLGEQIDGRQAARAAALASLQQTEADLVSIDVEIKGIQQVLDDEELAYDALSAQKAAKEAERSGVLGELQALLDTLGGAITAAVTALQELTDRLQEEILELATQMLNSQAKIAQALATKGTREAQQGQLVSSTVALGNTISVLEGEMALLEQQKSEAESRLPLIATLLSVTEQELAQLPLDADAERLLVVAFGSSMSPVPLFGQLLLDVVKGTPAVAAPFFQGHFSGATQLNAYADLTGSFIDIRGFTLQLDLFGMPGDTLATDYFQVTLLAGGIEKVFLNANPTPAPVGEPATLVTLATGLAAAGWWRRR